MQVVTGAMGSLIPKLWGLVRAEYKLQTELKKEVESLARDLETAYAALEEVAQVPPDQLPKKVKLWARDIREASYDMEDVLDTFLVRVEGSNDDPVEKDSKLKHLRKKMTKLFKKSKARHDIAGEIDKIKKRLQEVKERHATFTAGSIVSKPAAPSPTDGDPRLAAMYTQARDIIGINKSMDAVISLLKDGGSSKTKVKIVSFVGAGGLGKTTLAKQVYDKLQPQFDCGAFVPVGQNPDPKKVIRDILIDLDKEKYIDPKYTILDKRQLIDELKDFIRTKRYFIVIDDIWEAETWKNIKWAFIENNSGSRIIITTRKLEVTTDEEVYNLQPLSHENSRKLFFTRLYGEGKFPDNQSSEVHKASEEILKKCGGVPLAIITMASFLVGKSREQWFELCSSAGFIHNKDTKWILSLSFNDLPPHLRTCLLYLSAFPEDSFIAKDQLIWKWIAEGFVEEKQGMWLFEVGEGYFNDLVNKSMVQAAEIKTKERGQNTGQITHGCRVHDMVLDLLREVSREENFFLTISDSDEVVAARSSSGSKVRRLAVQNRTNEYIFSHRDNIAQVRSFISSMDYTRKLDSFQGFKLLRVLAVENCCTVDLEHIGKLIHLRYLELSGILSRATLPEAIGDLKFLQTLNLMGCPYTQLPSSISRLTQLICLRADHGLPNGVLGKLTCLEELDAKPCNYEDFKRQFAKDLSNLTRLRVLRTDISMDDCVTLSDLLQSIGELQRIQCLSLSLFISHRSRAEFETLSTQLVVPCGLSYLDFRHFHLHSLPPCIDPSHLANLSHLILNMCGLDGQGLESLSRLPQLRHLSLRTNSTAMLPNVAGNGRFQKLRSCSFPWSTVRFMLNGDSSVSLTLWNGKDGDMDFVSSKKEEEEEERVAPAVMPNLQELQFRVHRKALDDGGCCDLLGLEYLISLQEIRVQLDWPHDFCTSVLEKEEAALRRVVEAHPNHPMFQTLRLCRWS